MKTSKKTNLVTIEPNAKTFIANGREYFIEGNLSIERYSVYRKFELEFAYGVSFREMFDRWKQIYNLVNQTKFADAAVLAHNVMTGISKVDNNEVEAVRFCTLFINTADEDRRVYDETVMNQKIADWREQGIDASFFFRLSKSMTIGFEQAYQHSLDNTFLSNQTIS